jgi:phospholipase C
LTQADPPHSWRASHAQWNEGANDGFVTEHEGTHEREVMGYFSREELPFTYWLADNFTLCDRWHASVMGPTCPNRAVLHAADAAGLKWNHPFLRPPTTIWDELPSIGKTGKNYFAGESAIYSALFRLKPAQVDPTEPLEAFFEAARTGTLPHFVMIDPDYDTNDDHPAHNVHLGQVLISSVYRALAASPQWSRCLFVITYDEHGGFFDHVPPPECDDADPRYRRLGFRVPSLVIGPTVRQSAVCSTLFEHASVAATLRTRFGLPVLSERMQSTNDLSSCIDPSAIGHPRRPPENPPVIRLGGVEELLRQPPVHGQPELTEMIARGEIALSANARRTRRERVMSWLEIAHGLGAVEMLS